MLLVPGPKLLASLKDVPFEDNRRFFALRDNMDTELATLGTRSGCADRRGTEPSMNADILHQEHHSDNNEIVSDAIIGFADGLTVPFALTAGLSSVGSLNLVILGGLAELFAGAISMGLGAFLATVTEDKHYRVVEAREWKESLCLRKLRGRRSTRSWPIMA